MLYVPIVSCLVEGGVQKIELQGSQVYGKPVCSGYLQRSQYNWNLHHTTGPHQHCQPTVRGPPPACQQTSQRVNQHETALAPRGHHHYSGNEKKNWSREGLVRCAGGARCDCRSRAKRAVPGCHFYFAAYRGSLLVCVSLWRLDSGGFRFWLLGAPLPLRSGSVAFGRRATVPGLGRQTDWLAVGLGSSPLLWRWMVDCRFS